MTPQYNSVISAVDNHNVANGDSSWFDRAAEFVGDVATGLAVGTPSAVVAGVNSILNTGIAVANWFGADVEPINTYEVMRNFDEDLGQYYKEHQQGIEIAGFVIGSFAPGMAGVKALQAAKAGFLGTNMAKSSGLMKSMTADYAKLARQEFASGTSPFSILNENTMKALAQGVGTNALEAAAFETFVVASMYQSPVLNEMSAKDIFWNSVVGVGLGGGIGGVLSGVKTVRDIKKAREVIGGELFPYRDIQFLDELASPELKLINLYQQKFNMPEAALGKDIVSDLTPEARMKLITQEREKTLERIDNLIQQEFIKYSGGDAHVGRNLYEMYGRVTSLDDVAASLLHSKYARRISENESLTFGEVQFPIHKLTISELQDLKTNFDPTKILSPKGGEGARGFFVKGDVNQLKVTGFGVKEGNVQHSRESAFAQGYDLFRNANGSISVNPESKILVTAERRRAGNNLIIDFEQSGAIVEKATASLADFATKANPVRVSGMYVSVGERGLIAVPEGNKWNPLDEDLLKVQSRYVWAQEQKNIKWDKMVVNENDIPLLERAYYDGDAAKGFIIKMEDNKNVNAPTGEALRRFIENKKRDLAEKMDGKPVDEIGFRLNVTDNWLYGGKDELSRLRPGVDYNNPRYARIDYPDDLHALDTYNAAHIDAAVEYQRQVQLIKERHNQNFTNFVGSDAEYFPDAPNWNDPGRKPVGSGAGSTLFGFANAAYESAASWAQQVGTLTNKLKITKKKEVADQLNAALAGVKLEGDIAVAELSLLTNRLRASPDAYVFHPQDPRILIPREEFVNAKKGAISDPQQVITIKSDKVRDFLILHSTLNNERQAHIKNLKSAAGLGDNHDPSVVYPPPIRTDKYKHFVIVEPKGLNVGDKKRVLAAKDEQTLTRLMSQINKDEFRIWTKQESEDFHKAIGDYDFSLGLNDSVVDSSLKRKGILSDALPTTSSERILDEFMEWHMNQVDNLATRMVEHKYSQAFQELENLGRAYTNISTSQFGRSISERIKKTVKDPFYDVVKTALDISRIGEYQWWRSFNDIVRNTIETPIHKIRETFRSTNLKSEADWDKFVSQTNKLSEDMGLGTPFQNAYAAMVANGNVADKPFLARGIAKAQALLSSTLLQWDFFNAIVNSVSMPIILSSEINYIRQAIAKNNPEIAGKLTALMSSSLPDGSGITIPTTMRLIKNALENYRLDHSAGGGVLLQRYRAIGAVSDILQQERMMLDELTINYNIATKGEVDRKVSKATELARTWTGNKLAEEMTRFVSADVGRQIGELALEAGVLKNAGEVNELILSITNKTQGNYLHSQRPIVFQGVVGQAISLFQTYQFNLMQQLFKYVGDGDKKSLSILLGLQGSIYGTQGLPAFHFLNTHIVGNASGNTNHRDLYYAANTVFGKNLADWLIYGIGSNALGIFDPSMRANIYTRGDINPRQVTVLPAQLEDIPIVSASVRFVKNLWNMSEKIANGGAFWPAISQGLEHNSLSRPLTGLAQVVQGYTTTNQASILSMHQDLFSVATLTRVMGGKPFDEAIALDALYRINAYRAKDISQIQELGSAIKTTVVGGGTPSEEQVVEFAKQYARRGGRIENFNRFFTGIYMGANQSQVNKMAQHLTSPFAQQLQITMGGRPLPDFLNTREE